MRAQFTASRVFGCATRTEGSERLSSKTIRIAATVTGESMTSYHETFGGLTSLTQELEGRVLEDMMPGAATTILGIAAWTMERLAGALPKLVRVEVTELHRIDGDATVALERTPNTGV